MLVNHSILLMSQIINSFSKSKPIKRTSSLWTPVMVLLNLIIHYQYLSRLFKMSLKMFLSNFKSIGLLLLLKWSKKMILKCHLLMKKIFIKRFFLSLEKNSQVSNLLNKIFMYLQQSHQKKILLKLESLNKRRKLHLLNTKKRNKINIRFKVQRNRLKFHKSKIRIWRRLNNQLNKSLNNKNKFLMMFISIVVQTICWPVYLHQVKDCRLCRNKTNRIMKNNLNILEVNKLNNLEKLIKSKAKPVNWIIKSSLLKLLTQNFLS